MTDDIPEPKIQITLPRLSDAELAKLVKWGLSRIDRGRFVPLAKWLVEVCLAEVARRKSNDPDLAEPGMFAIPNWAPADCGEALMGSTILSYEKLTAAEAAFVDAVVFHVVAYASVVLREYEERHNSGELGNG